MITQKLLKIWYNNHIERGDMKNSKLISRNKIFATLLALLISVFILASCSQNQANNNKDIGVAWCTKSNYENCLLAVNEAGGNSSLCDQVKLNDVKYNDEGKLDSSYLESNGCLNSQISERIKSKPYDDTNVKKVATKYKAIVFPGGADICPSLYKNPQAWYDDSVKPSFDPARDISDYILMAYCLDNDIPVLAICRGMQMYGVVSGAEMIQDLPTYFKEQGVPYNDEHRSDVKNSKYGNHPVYISDKHSLMYNAYKEDVLDKPYSSHHQAVKSIDPSNSKVVAKANINGVETIEALERANSFAFGLFIQFHPEASLAAHVNNKDYKDNYMSYDESLKVFKYFVGKVS